jgi:cytoskeleton protein RodZ
MTRVPKDMSRRQRVPPRPGSAGEANAGSGQGSGPGDLPPGEGGAPVRRPPPWHQPSEPETASFGSWLRRQREMREISLRDIADRTKISLRYLEAMEDDRFDLLPAPIFAKGFLREYARYVGLSPDEVVNHYLAVQQQQSPEEDGIRKDQTLVNRPHRVQPQPRSWTYGLFLALAVLVLIALIWALAWYNNHRREQQPAADSAPSSMPAMTAPPGPAGAQTAAAAPVVPEKPSAPLEVTLDFIADCWVEVRVDDKPFLSEQRVQGESLPIEAQKSVDIRLGDTAAAEIQVNGQTYPLNGKRGEVREFRIDLETVRQLQEKKEAL